MGYHISNDDSDKENDPNAAEIPPQSQGKGMGSHSRHHERRREGRRGVGDAEEGPIRLYHPWQMHAVRVQAGHSTSLIPHFFELNQGPAYIPFLITNDQGQEVPAKYVSVHMTANPYALGKLTSDGPTKWGEIHAAPRYDYSHVKGYSDNNLHELLPSWHKSLDVDKVLVEMRDRSLQAEVHWYRCQMTCLKQLNDQMEAIQAEMFTILYKNSRQLQRLCSCKYKRTKLSTLSTDGKSPLS